MPTSATARSRAIVDEVLARARDAGVVAVVAVGETRADAERNLELAEAYPGESCGRPPACTPPISILRKRNRSLI